MKIPPKNYYHLAMLCGILCFSALAGNVQATSPDWSSTDIHYQARVWSSFRTEPSTWASEGGFGLRWGMGPGDVSKVYPSFQFVFPDSSKDLQQGTSSEVLQGLKATIFFRFFRGRLYKIEISPEVGSVETFDDIGARRKEWWGWRERLGRILQDSYGNPSCAPSKRTITNMCENQCGTESNEKRTKLLRWVWRTPRSEIVLTGGYVPRLFYQDLSLISSVHQARGVAQLEKEMEKDRKASADRERLGGKPENQSLAGPLLSSTPDIKMDLPPPPVECFPDDEPSADASTPAKSWSKTGWASFRWNMGPADVKALIEPEPQREVTWHPGVLGEGDRLIVPSGIKAFGRDVSTTFNFKKDRLTSIRFGVTCDDVDVKNIECERWRRDVMANFDKQYGKSRCVKETDHERCHWDYPDKAWVSLKRYGDADKFVTLSLELEDSALRPTRVVDHMKRKGAPQKAWSKFGWNGFQWGMGIVDAQRRLSDPNGNMQANRELVCHAIQKEIGTVECKLERDFHKFEILGMIPSLVFKFSAGRLFSIQLHFPEGLDRLASWEKAEKLRQLLTDKYGKNSKDWSSSKEKNKSMNVDWDTNDINISFYARQTESSAWMVIRYENPVKGGGGEEPSDSDSTRSKL